MESGIYFDEPIKEKPSARKIVRWSLIGVVCAVLAFGAFQPSPYVIEAPGPVFNVLGNSGDTPIINVSGAKSYPTDGALNLLTVSVFGAPGQTPSWGEVLLAMLNPSEAISPVEAIFPPATNSKVIDQQNTLMMTDSQSQATAVALSALGYRYTSSVYVAAIGDRAKTGDHLKVADTIKTVNGQVITGYESIHKVVEASDGKPLEVAVVRSGKPLTLHVQPVLRGKLWRLGIYLGSKMHFPIKVNLNLANVGGPSGGTMFALGIYDKLTPGSLTGGQIIAGTGTIDTEGVVGAIGGIRQKMYGAVRAGAKWFLAPADNCNEVVGHIPNGLKVVKVATFTDALKAVKQIAANKSVAGLATCGK
jgi:PDZ domain-containing protein